MKTVEDPALSHEVNAGGALVLLDSSLHAGVKHFIFTSTSAVYGEASAPAQKEDGPKKPISPYGVAKLAAEHYAKYFWAGNGLPTTSVRIFNVYGPRQNPESKYSLAVPGILSKIFKGERPVIDGTGEQARDFIYIDDILRALLLIEGRKKTYGEVYNLGSGRAYSISRLAKELLRLTGSRMKPVHGPGRPGDPDRTCADVSKIRRHLGWKPRVSFEEGLEKTVQWAKKAKSAF